MAQYRYSASIIKRSEGRSVTAAAAYRAGEAIPDHATGIIHDWSRRSGVRHTEIVAPENTPSWMFNRTLLWNAVEAAEKRKDSQLSREVQLSLPHELTHDQRVELVRTFVKDVFAPRGLIADIAIHLPGKEGDERNHHAHILLTTRTLTGEGFGLKIRQTKEAHVRDLEAERAAWADHQNRTFERLGIPERVDHRSYADRMIDREPTQHLGPTASEMERRGRPSRIGDENREIADRNGLMAEAYRRAADNDNAKPTSSPVWEGANTKAEQQHQMRAEQERRERLALLDLDRIHQPQRIKLEADQEKRNGIFRNTIAEELAAIERRQQAKGVTRFFRTLTGWNRHDAQQAALLQKTLDGIEKREQTERRDLAAEHARQTKALQDQYARQRARLERGEPTMSNDKDDESKKAPQPREEREPPKLEPHLKPAPPRGAGQEFMPPSGKSFEELAKEWASTPESRQFWETDKNPSANEGFNQRSWDEVVDKATAETPDQTKRLTPSWDDVMNKPAEKTPDAAPDKTPAPEADQTRRLTPSWDDIVGKAEIPQIDRTPDRDGPDRD